MIFSIRALEQRFAATLCDEQAALYTLLCECRAEAAAEREAVIFTQGVRLGAKLIAEAAQPGTEAAPLGTEV